MKVMCIYRSMHVHDNNYNHLLLYSCTIYSLTFSHNS